MVHVRNDPEQVEGAADERHLGVDPDEIDVTRRGQPDVIARAFFLGEKKKEVLRLAM